MNNHEKRMQRNRRAGWLFYLLSAFLICASYRFAMIDRPHLAISCGAMVFASAMLAQIFFHES